MRNMNIYIYIYKITATFKSVFLYKERNIIYREEKKTTREKARKYSQEKKKGKNKTNSILLKKSNSKSCLKQITN